MRGTELNPIEKTIRHALERGDAADRAFREKIYRSVHAALERSLQSAPDLPEEAVQQRRDMLKESIRSIETEFLPAREAASADMPEAPAPVEREEPGFPPEARIAPDHVQSEAPEDDAAVPSVEPAARAPEGPVTSGHVGGTVDAPDFPTVEPRSARQTPQRHAPELEIRPDRRHPASQRHEPSFSDSATLGVAPEERRDVSSEPRGERRDLPRRRGRIYAFAFLAVTLLAAVGMGLWWTFDQGLFLSAEQRDTSVPNPPLTLEDEAFVPEGATPSRTVLGVANDTADWITIFDPSDPTPVTTPGGAEAAVVESTYGPVLRIRTASADEPVTFDVGQGVLDQIAGRTAVFNIVASSEEGQTTQISVTCDFGSLGDCGRRRFDATVEQADFLFNLEVPAGSPDAAGTIAIVSDLEGQGRAVDIRGIRVSAQD